MTKYCPSSNCAIIAIFGAVMHRQAKLSRPIRESLQRVFKVSAQ